MLIRGITYHGWGRTRAITRGIEYTFQHNQGLKITLHCEGVRSRRHGNIIPPKQYGNQCFLKKTEMCLNLCPSVVPLQMARVYACRPMHAKLAALAFCLTMFEIVKLAGWVGSLERRVGQDKWRLGSFSYGRVVVSGMANTEVLRNTMVVSVAQIDGSHGHTTAVDEPGSSRAKLGFRAVLVPS